MCSNMEEAVFDILADDGSLVPVSKFIKVYYYYFNKLHCYFLNLFVIHFSDTLYSLNEKMVSINSAILNKKYFL